MFIDPCPCIIIPSFRFAFDNPKSEYQNVTVLDTVNLFRTIKQEQQLALGPVVVR